MQPDTFKPGKAFATSKHNHNDMLDNSTESYVWNPFEITESCRHSWRQLSAFFRESPDTPKVLNGALFLVVLLLAAGDQMQEQMRLKSLTAFDKFNVMVVCGEQVERCTCATWSSHQK